MVWPDAISSLYSIVDRPLRLLFESASRRLSFTDGATAGVDMGTNAVPGNG